MQQNLINVVNGVKSLWTKGGKAVAVTGQLCKALWTKTTTKAKLVFRKVVQVGKKYWGGFVILNGAVSYAGNWDYVQTHWHYLKEFATLVVSLFS